MSLLRGEISVCRQQPQTQFEPLLRRRKKFQEFSMAPSIPACPSPFFLRLVAVFLLFDRISVLQIPGAVYHKFKGVDVQMPCLSVRTGVRGLSSCVAQCQRTASCRAGSYNSAVRRCCITSLFAYENGVVYEENQKSVYFQIPTNTVEYSNWTMVFRVLSGSSQQVYATWNKTGQYDDYWLGRTGMQLGCVTLNGSRACKTLFRSYLLDTWSTAAVKKVRVVLAKNGQEVLNLVFNGTGSSYMNWFHPSRILQSPWTDLSTSSSLYNSFSILGFDIHCRRFFINKSYAGCAGDTGWLAVVEDIGSREPCLWENFTAPVILYSGNSTVATWQSSAYSVRRADVFAVFIQR